jgi:phosphoribosylanthranilate isomerase
MAGVPQHIKKIGVFRDEELPVVLDCIAELGLDGVQLHGGEDASYALNIKKHSPGAFILKAVEVATGSNIHSLTTMHGIDMFLLDSGAGGTGVSFDWSLLQNYRSSVPFLLAGGLSEKHIEAALELMATVPQCRGIDVNSKVEISPGVKNIELVRQIIRRVRGV